MNLPPGTQIGPYTVTREIARGGQGAVLEAQDPTGRAVALKLLLDDEEEATARFLREAETLSRLNHPNLIRVRALAQTPGGVAYLAMELVRGQSLAEWVRGAGPPPLDQVREVVASAAEALHYCHEQGLVHRDLKPQNFLLEAETGRLVVVDFGLVRRNKLALAWSTEDQASLTQVGSVMGTPAYMPPEQVSPEFGAVDRRSDVYGLGATLFYLLTGEAPFRGSGVLQLLTQVVDSPAPDPCALRPDLPTDLASLCLRALAKDPLERPQTALEFAEALQAGAKSGGRRSLPLGAIGLTIAGGVVGLAALSLQARSPSTSPTPQATSQTPQDMNREALARAARLSQGEKAEREEAEALLLGLAKEGVPEAMFRLGVIRQEAGAHVEAIRWLKRGADAGDPSALVTLGLLYQKGEEAAPKDMAAARACFQRAADAGHPQAMLHLGTQLTLGHGGAADVLRGIEWLKRAAALGDPTAMLLLGHAARGGKGTPPSLAEAALWYQRAVDHGDPESLLRLAELYRDGAGVPRDLERSAGLLKRAAEAGVTESYLPYAHALLLGRGTPTDESAALDWYKRAADLGSLEAAGQVGVIYFVGRPGLKADPLRGIPWLERAAQGGRVLPMFHLGQALLIGRGAEVNESKGAFWVRQAAGQEYAPAMILYAKLLARGQGVPKDQDASLGWLERAATAGDVAAMRTLGCDLRTYQRPREALPWLDQAAKAGDTRAMFNLAACYLIGEGTPVDLPQAKKWFRRVVETAPSSPLGKRAKGGLLKIKQREEEKGAKAPSPKDRRLDR